MLTQLLSVFTATMLFWSPTQAVDITSANFTTLYLNERKYCLSKESYYTYSDAKNNCPKIKAELAFFDNNEEYHLVYKILSNLSREIWIEMNYTISVDSKYIFSWRHEVFNGSVWVLGQPNDINCLNITQKCCARIYSSRGLMDIFCDSRFGYLCKPLPQCILHAADCILNCGEPITSYNCLAGFSFNATTVACDDVDECGRNISGCQQTCHNSPGSYSCGCHPGYVLGINNHSCEDINECLSNDGSCQHICENMEGSFQCECRTGYSLGSDNKTCDDVDECSLSSHQCQQNCSNSDGSYGCWCQDGFFLSSNGHNCTKLETCLTSQCQHICINTSTSYTCQCYPGYTLDADGIMCSDVNECDPSECERCLLPNVSNQCPLYCNSSSNLCDQGCVNVNGSYQCSCSSGYFLSQTDNKTCHDIDECSLDCSLCEVYCNNTPGSYYCSCPPGYHLSEDKYSCEKTTLNNYCPCSCIYSKVNILRNKEQMYLYLDILRKSLQVNKSNLLSTRLQLTSQEDSTVGNTAIGYFGILFLVIVISALMFLDLTKLICKMYQQDTFSQGRI